jgi:hypothetical protein
MTTPYRTTDNTHADDPLDLFSGTSLANYDTITGLVAEYQSIAEKIDHIAGFMSAEMRGAMSYFIEGNGNPDSRTIGVTALFDREGAVAALDAAFWQRAMQMTEILDIMPQARRDTKNYNKGDGEDWTFHEVKKFLATLATGNPNAIEALFMPAECLVMGEPALVPFWEELVAHRRLFLTERVMIHTIAYASSQLKRVRGEPVRESQKRPNKPVDRMKDACHGIRLLLNARDIAEGREPSVRLAGAERATVKSVRAGHLGDKVIVELADALIGHIDGLKPWPVAADWPLDFASDWLLRLRRHDLDHAPAAARAPARAGTFGTDALEDRLRPEAGGAPPDDL